AANTLEFTSDVYDTIVYNTESQPVKLPGYRVDALTDAAIRYVDSHQQDPFFLFISYLEPHHQNHLDDYPPPAGYRVQHPDRGPRAATRARRRARPVAAAPGRLFRHGQAARRGAGPPAGRRAHPRRAR